MNDDKSIDLKTENTNLTNELIVLRRKYKELDEDRHYVKSLLDAEFEKGIELKKENEQLKSSLYAEKTNTAEVVNDYSKQFKRHSAQFSFMMDLADDLGVDVTTLEALDD